MKVCGLHAGLRMINEVVRRRSLITKGTPDESNNESTIGLFVDCHVIRHWLIRAPWSTEVYSFATLSLIKALSCVFVIRLV